MMARGVFVAILPDISDRDSFDWIGDGVLDISPSSSDARWLAYGLEPCRPVGHVYFEIDVDRSVKPVNGHIRYSYDVLIGEADSRAEVLRRVVGFIWEKHAGTQLEDILQTVTTPDDLARVAYESLFSANRFVSFGTGDSECGGFRAESLHETYFRRPEPVVWNQYWFNGQRTAYGLLHYGQKFGNTNWLDSAQKITNTSLAAPSWKGLFPAIYAYEDRAWWGSIPRLNGGKTRVHVADSAMTGEWLLRRYADFDQNPALLRRCIALGDVLLDLQEASGAIPAWYDWDGEALRVVPELRSSAETGAAASFIADLALETQRADFASGAIGAAEFLATDVIDAQCYQDFETFYSCSTKPLDFRDEFTGLYPMNTLAVFWTASVMLKAYKLTGDTRYLNLGCEVVDLLSLFQQVWSPPFLSLRAFGGFGVMNTDAEWSDARQSLFAPLYFDFHRATGEREYFDRGRAAAAASLVLACLPKHQYINPKGFDTHPDGIMPENYGHSGRDEPSGRSDTCWGECGALSATALIEKGYTKLNNG
jgi:hypothetical protein